VAAYEIHELFSEIKMQRHFKPRPTLPKKHQQGKPPHPSLRPTPQKQPIHDKRQRPRGKQAARRKEEKKRALHILT